MPSIPRDYLGEGHYLPDLFSHLKNQHITILAYHRHPSPDWDSGEFTPASSMQLQGDVKSWIPRNSATKGLAGLLRTSVGVPVC